MAWVEDPATGEWYDDGEYTDFLGVGNRFLNPQLMGDLSKYGVPEATDIATQGRQLTNADKALDFIFDPRASYFNAVVNNQPTFPFESLMQGQGGVGDPMMMGGGGMGMGGGGGGGGMYGGGGGMDNDTIWANMYLNSVGQSQDPVLQTIYSDVMEGNLDPVSVKSQLLSSGIADQNQLDLYNDAVDKLFTAKVNLQQGQMMGAGQPQQMPATQLGQIAGKWGTVNPLQGYSAENLPADALSDYGASLAPYNKRAESFDAAQRKALQDAVYRNAPPTAAAAVAPVEEEEPLIRPEELARMETLKERNPEAWQRQVDMITRNRRENRAGGNDWTGQLAWEKPFGGVFSGPDIEAKLGPGFAQQGGAPAAAVGGQPLPRGGGGLLRGAVQGFLHNEEADPLRYRTQGGGRTNLAGKRAQYLQQRATGERENMAAADQWTRELASRRLAGQGRSPQRDAMQAQLNLLRQFGVGV